MAPLWKLTPERREKLETAARQVHETCAEYHRLSGARDQAEARAEHARMVFILTCNELLPVAPHALIERAEATR